MILVLKVKIITNITRHTYFLNKIVQYIRNRKKAHFCAENKY